MHASLIASQPATRASTAPFFALTFLITWGLQLPGVAAQAGLLPGGVAPYMPFVVLGVFGPAAAAALLGARSGGREEVRALFTGLADYRVHPVWYVIALLLPGLLLSLGCAAMRSLGHSGPVLFVPEAGRLLVGVFISIGEEVGWRGYALPRLQRRYGPVAASGVIAVFWTLWHVPMWLGTGTSLALLPVALLQLLGGSLMFTWIYNRTGGSLLLAVMAHLGAHLNNSQLALPRDTLPAVIHALSYAAIGMLAVRFDRKAFPLGFRR